MKFSSQNRGYTLLFATLTAAVVLSVAIFISTVARKQYILASTARDSMFAIYNADSALECAAETVLNLTGDDEWLDPGEGVFTCNDADYQFVFQGSPVNPRPDDWSEDAYQSEPIEVFFYDDPAEPVDTSRGCAVVTVLASADLSTKLQIDSRGYNLGNSDTGCPTVGPRTVERAMRVTYE